MPIIVCIECYATFREMEELQRHEKTCKPPSKRKVWRQSTVSEEQNHREELEIVAARTWKRKGNNQLVTETVCEECGLTITGVLNLQKHMSMNHSVRCEQCGLRTAGKAKQKIHMDKYHSNEEQCCEICGEKVTKSTLKVHRKIHERTCELCSRTLNSKNTKKKHIYFVHGIGDDINVTCENCGKNFKGKRGLKYHERLVHKRIRNAVCDLCGEAFPINSALKKHKKAVHEKLKPFKCEVCDFCCAAHPNLNLHRGRQHNLPKMKIEEYRLMNGRSKDIV